MWRALTCLEGGIEKHGAFLKAFQKKVRAVGQAWAVDDLSLFEDR